MPSTTTPTSLGYARRLLAIDALHEPACRLLMDALVCAAASGARRCASTTASPRRLARDLGVTPEPATTAIAERLRGAPAAPAPGPPWSGARPSGGRRARYGGRLPLAGARLLLVTGEAGIGKSRLGRGAGPSSGGGRSGGGLRPRLRGRRPPAVGPGDRLAAVRAGTGGPRHARRHVADRARPAAARAQADAPAAAGRSACHRRRQAPSPPRRRPPRPPRDRATAAARGRRPPVVRHRHGRALRLPRPELACGSGAGRRDGPRRRRRRSAGGGAATPSASPPPASSRRSPSDRSIRPRPPRWRRWSAGGSSAPGGGGPALEGDRGQPAVRRSRPCVRDSAAARPGGSR